MLPVGWAETTLDEIGIWGSGGTPKATNPSFYGGSIPWVRSGDLPDGPIEDHEATITDDGLKNSAAKWVPPGSVLIAMYGATIGKVGLSTYPLTTNQAVAFVKPFEQISEHFLFALLKSCKLKFIELSQGGAQPNISQEILKRQPIDLPPLAEQRRIVAKLDALTARLARARAELERVPILAANLRSKVLLSTYNLEFARSASIEIAIVGDVSNISSGYGFPKHLQGKEVGRYPFAKVSDISRSVASNRGLLEQATNYVDEDDLQVLRVKPVQARSTVFAKIGEALRLNRRAITQCELILDNNCMALSPKQEIVPEYLYYFMRNGGPFTVFRCYSGALGSSR